MVGGVCLCTMPCGHHQVKGGGGKAGQGACISQRAAAASRLGCGVRGHTANNKAGWHCQLAVQASAVWGGGEGREGYDAVSEFAGKALIPDCFCSSFRGKYVASMAAIADTAACNNPCILWMSPELCLRSL